MPWEDAAELESRVNRALNNFEWEEVEAICDEIIARAASEAERLEDRPAGRILGSLRRKSRFALMMRVAKALLDSGVRSAGVRRQYAQSLLELGEFFQAEQTLDGIIRDPTSKPGEVAEAKGLLGRHYKQLFANDPAGPRARAHLERALKEYAEGYEIDREENYWHGINVLALTERARRDGWPAEALRDARALAEEIIATLDDREDNGKKVYAFDEATRMEAYVALGQHKKALDTALRYVDCADADAFELQSTMRQLRQIWQLDESAPPGDQLLPLLGSAHLKQSGGAFELDPRRVASEAAAAKKAEDDDAFQALLGSTKMQKFRWYRKGLAQCAAIARIELVSEEEGAAHDGIGTGWLVRAEDFFPGWTGVLVLTNDHVLSLKPRADGRPVHSASIRPERAEVNFQVTGEVFKVESVVLSSYYKELDYAFLRLKGEGVPQAAPLVLHEDAVAMDEPPPRMYVIGYPMGRDLEIGLQDNLLIACNERLIHYRTPTEHGNSGSPVFEPADWRVVALHHKGSKTLSRLDNPETKYEANEGVTIRAIQEETRRANLPPPATPPGGAPVRVNKPF